MVLILKFLVDGLLDNVSGLVFQSISVFHNVNYFEMMMVYLFLFCLL